MRESRGLASLSPDLLARKGGAKPAMRRQAFYGAAQPADAPAEDLGWNDFGSEQQSATAASAPLARLDESAHTDFAAETPDVPEVLRRIAELSRRIADDPVPVPSPRPAGRRTAFTLRLDADRHMRLRLISTVLDRSAQDIVTEALDHYIAQHPEISSLADLACKRRQETHAKG